MSFHEDLGRKPEPRGSSDRSFGIVFAVFCWLVGLSPLRRHQPPRFWALAMGGLFLAIALLQPVWLGPLNRAWAKLGLLMGRVASPVVTGLLFLLVVTPMGFFARLFGRDPLRLTCDSGVASYWIERRPPGPSPGTMPNQF